MQLAFADAVAGHARTTPNRVACVELESGYALDWLALDALVDRIASILFGYCGAGDRVAWLGRNGIDLLATQLACTRHGLIFVPLNWRLAPAELAVLLDDAAPKLLVHDDEYSSAADLALPTGSRLVTMALKAAAALSPRHVATVQPDDHPVTLLYTSGTSGRPKGVILTRCGMMTATLNMAIGSRLRQDSVFLCDMPMFHTVGMVAGSLTTMMMGGRLLISAGFDPAKTLARIADPALGVTHYFCAPQMAEQLRAQPASAGADWSRLVAICTGGAPHPAAAVRRWIALGVPLLDGYGMSETGSVMMMPLGDLALLEAKAGSCGRILPATEVRLVDDTGCDVPPGASGELWLRGANITPGYWNQPSATAAAFAEGWLRTGDVARVDADGFFYLLDRKKDMFISGGENIYPAEVEAALRELPAIADVAVIGVPDPRWGEVGHAYVVLAAGATLDAEACRAHCQERIARYKVPAQISFIDSLPRTASGKIQKHLVRPRH